MRLPDQVTLVKLGGSLITDKRRPATARPEVIARLAAELAELHGAGEPLVLGHGSGSFGHVAASESGVHEGIRSPDQVVGAARTQLEAGRLHQLVVAALCDAGAAPFSLPPSAAMVSRAGRPVSWALEPLLRALAAGLLPVLRGDVVLDRERGAAICSTETVFTALVGRLRRRGVAVTRILWLGETDGVYGPDGATVTSVSVRDAPALLAEMSGAAGADVTGGMRHRLETAVGLARRGVSSWILDGRIPGVIGRAIAGSEPSGTRVPASS